MPANEQVPQTLALPSRWNRLWKTALVGLTTLAGGLFVGEVDAKQPFHPFAESMDIDPDYQWFAPVDLMELEELSARKRANRGWFVAYDRLHFGLDRPDTNGISSKIDMTWGNRWDFGFMGDSDRGWLFSAMHVSGPNVYNDVRHLRTVLPTATAIPRGVFRTIRHGFLTILASVTERFLNDKVSTLHRYPVSKPTKLGERNHIATAVSSSR